VGLCLYILSLAVVLSTFDLIITRRLQRKPQHTNFHVLHVVNGGTISTIILHSNICMYIIYYNIN